MAIKVINIKQESIQSFLKENLVNFDKDCKHSVQGIIDNPVTYLKKEIVIKKGVIPNGINELAFHVEDHTALGRMALIVIYRYAIDLYDDVSDELIFTGVEVLIKK